MAVVTLMLIGGSAGSAAGGIKNNTAGILFLSALNFVRGKNRLSVYGRTVPQQQVSAAAAILVIMASACFAGAAAISLIQPKLPISGVFFETVSAVAICGLSHGITSSLTAASQAIIMAFMFFGRVGILTISMATFTQRFASEKTKCPDEWILIG